MATPTSTTLDTETLSWELTELDRLLHRIREKLTGTSARSRTDVKAVLERTGGVLHHKATEAEIIEWQRKIRAEWES